LFYPGSRGLFALPFAMKIIKINLWNQGTVVWDTGIQFDYFDNILRLTFTA
jgi:hypothetical protein